MSFWLVGEAPTPRVPIPMTPDDTGIPHAANRLLTITGWSCDEFCRIFSVRTTVWNNPTRLWMEVGRTAAAKLVERGRSSGAQGIAIMGPRAAEAFQMDDFEPFSWVGLLAVIPCPAARTKWWYSRPDSREVAQSFFQEIRCRSQSSSSGG